MWPIETLRVGLLSTIAAFVVASVAAVVAGTLRWRVALTALSALGLLVLGLAGHAGGSADHETAVNALAAHLLSAAVWVGGLLALIVLRGPLGESLGVVVRRYSTVALWCFVTARRLRRHVGDDADSARGPTSPRRTASSSSSRWSPSRPSVSPVSCTAASTLDRIDEARRRGAHARARAAGSSCASPWSRRSSWGSRSVSRRRWRAASRPCPRRWPTRALPCR